jgi:type IV secretory pathway VirB2 component (pilin)
MKLLRKERLKTAAAVGALSAAMPAVSYAQAVGGTDAGTVMTNAVTYLLGPFGIGVASILVIIIAILLAIGRHTYEGILLAIIAIALYFGGPGLVAKIAGGGG